MRPFQPPQDPGTPGQALPLSLAFVSEPTGEPACHCPLGPTPRFLLARRPAVPQVTSRPLFPASVPSRRFTPSALLFVLPENLPPGSHILALLTFNDGLFNQQVLIDRGATKC